MPDDSKKRVKVIYDDATETSQSEKVKLGDLSLETPDGVINVTEADGLDLNVSAMRGLPAEVFIALSDKQKGEGMYLRLSPKDALELAMSMAKAASMADPKAAQ